MTRRHQLLRLACAALLGSALALPVSSSAAPPSGDPAPTPAARCGPGSRPETGLQGDIPQADVTSGRVKQGYTCNAQLVSHIGVGGGYRVERYIERSAQIDSQLRQRLVMMITDLPPNIGPSRVAQAALRLRPFCRKVGYALDELEPPQVELSMAASPIIAIDAGRVLRGTSLPERELRALCDLLHVHRAQLLVRQIPDRRLAASLAKLGVDLVSFAAAP